MIDRQLAQLLMGSRRLVNAKALSTDPSYQRPPDRDKITALANGKRAMRPIFVNRRADGTLWIIDGQHRALAQIRRNRPLIEAWMVHIPQTAEHEVYAQLNGLVGVETEPTSIVK